MIAGLDGLRAAAARLHERLNPDPSPTVGVSMGLIGDRPGLHVFCFEPGPPDVAIAEGIWGGFPVAVHRLGPSVLVAEGAR